MKLKLEASGEVSVLTLILEPTENLSAQQVAVLKAGIAKLVATGKRKFVIDVTQAANISPEAQTTLVALMNSTPDPQTPVEILLAGPAGAVLDAAAGIAALSNGLCALVIQEFKLTQRRDRLRELSGKAAEKIAKLADNPTIQAIRDLRRQNGQMRREIQTLESVLKFWKTTGSLPAGPNAAQDNSKPSDEQAKLREEIENQISTVFAQKKIFDSLEQKTEGTT